MQNKVSFVTGLYDGLHNTEFNGRQNRGSHYALSLCCLDNMGVPIHCFTDDINYCKFSPVFAAHNVKNIEFICFNLEDIRNRNKINEIKRSNKDWYLEHISWKSRSVEIMWGKFEWIKHVALQYDPDDYVFWIDAGLSHHGVIPLSLYNDYFGQTFANNATEYQAQFFNSKAFNPKFVRQLVEYTGDKILNIAASYPQHSDKIPDELSYQKHYNGSAIGGLFGGKVKSMINYCDGILELCDVTLRNNVLLKEEQLMTVYLNNHVDQFIVFEFDTWYHIDWDVYRPTDVSFSDFFKELERGKK